MSSYILMDIHLEGKTNEIVDKGYTDTLLPFRKGERLTYDLRYKKINVGKSIMTFYGIETLNNRKVYHITFFTRMNAFTDNEELYADIDTFLPVEVHRTIKKFGTFTTDIEERYDQKGFKVDIKQKTRFRSKEFSIEKDSVIHNAILLTYFYRLKNRFNQGERFKVTLPTYDCKIRYVGMETIDTSMGEYNTYAFFSEPSRFKFWLSADDKKTPLKIENPTKLEYSLIIESID